MASRRIYLPSTGTAAVSPAFDSSWTSTSGADRIAAVLDTPSGSGFATKSASGTGATSAIGYLLRQYVTPAICVSYATSTAFALAAIVDDGSGHLQQCVTPGTTGSSSPTWNHAGGTTADGTVVWQDIGSTTVTTGPAGTIGIGYGQVRCYQTYLNPAPYSYPVTVSRVVASVYSASNTLKAVISENGLGHSPVRSMTTWCAMNASGLVEAPTAGLSTDLSGSFTVAAGDYVVLELGVAQGAYHYGASESWTAELEFGDSAGSDFAATFAACHASTSGQLNPWITLDIGGGTPAPPPAPYIPGAWYVANEPTLGLTDRSAYLHMIKGKHSWNLQLRNRGKASYTLRVRPGDSYAPTIGTPVYFFDINASGSTLVWSGILQAYTARLVGSSGLVYYDCTAVSMESLLDTVFVDKPIQYVNQTCGYIVTDLFNRYVGSTAPIALGTVQAGPTIPLFTPDVTTKLSEIFGQLATTAQFIWGVNAQTLQLFFEAPTVTAAPFSITSKQALWNSLTAKYDNADYRNRQAVKLSYDAFSHSMEYFQGTGQQTITLARPVQQITNAYITLSTPNTATGTFSGNLSPGDTITIGPASGAWQANHVYAVGGVIIVGGYVQKVTAVSGTNKSGGTQPTFNTVTGGTTTDNVVIWTCQGPAGLGTGTQTYTFGAALDNTQFGEVLIGGSAAATCQNLMDAINRYIGTAAGRGPGINYSLPTWENSQCNAINISGASFTLQQKAAGSGWVASLSSTGANFAWSAASTSGGTSPSGSVGPGEGATITIQSYVQGTSTAAPAVAYTPGSNVISLATPLNSGTNLNIEYTRPDGDIIQVENSSLVAAMAALTHGSGKVQQATDQSKTGLIATSSSAGLQLAQQIIEAFGVTPLELAVDTFVPGLAPGQQVTVALSGSLSSLNGNYVVREVSAGLVPLTAQKPYIDSATAPGGGHYRYTAKLIDVAQIASWLDFWAGLAGGASGGAAGSGIVPSTGGAQSTVGQPSLSLQINGTANSSQSVLNLVAGSNITLTDLGGGSIGIASGGGGGGGGVTSVAMTVPSFLSVSGSPITTAGTLAVSLATQNTNLVFAGPATGSAAAPAFRSLAAADIPASLDGMTFTGVTTLTGQLTVAASSFPAIQITTSSPYGSSTPVIQIPNFGTYRIADSAGTQHAAIWLDNANPDVLHLRNNQRASGGTISIETLSSGGASATLSAAGVLTLSQYGAGVLVSSSAGVISSASVVSSFAVENANLVFAGPAAGSAAAPTFRSLVAADIPKSVPVWIANTSYSAGSQIVDSSGNAQQASYFGPFWQASHAYSLGDAQYGNPALSWSGTYKGNKMVCIRAGTSGSSQPAWNNPIYSGAFWSASHSYGSGNDILDSNGNTQQASYFGPFWQASHAYSLGDAQYGNPALSWSGTYKGNKMVCTTAGTSGATQPAWNNPQTASWAASTNYAQNAVITDSHGNLQKAVYIGPFWQASHGYSAGDVISGAPAFSGAYGADAMQALSTGTTGSTQPTWSNSPGNAIVDNTILWQNIGAPGTGQSGASAPSWNLTTGGLTYDHNVCWVNQGAAGSSTVMDGSVVWTNEGPAVTSGSSGSSAPTWNGTTGGYTIDNNVAWLNQGASASAVVDSGVVWADEGAALTSGVSGSSTPSWSGTTGGFTTDHNIVWTCLGVYVPPAIQYVGSSVDGNLPTWYLGSLVDSGISVASLAMPLAIAVGGTGATTASAARTNLGIPANFLQIANNLSDVGNPATAAHNLGLGAADAVVFATVNASTINVLDGGLGTMTADIVVATQIQGGFQALVSGVWVYGVSVVFTSPGGAAGYNTATFVDGILVSHT